MKNNDDLYDAMRFFASVTHDDRESIYTLCTRDLQGKWEEKHLGVKFLEKELARHIGCAGHDTYITPNGFCCCSRKARNCRQVNDLYLDIDVHEVGADTSKNKAEIVRLVNGAVADGTLPEPTMLVDSGRGVNLHYILRRSVPVMAANGGRAVSFARDVHYLLAARLKKALGDHGSRVDMCVVGDLSRVVRIPGTFNTAAGSTARIIGGSGEQCDLDALLQARPAAAEATGALIQAEQNGDATTRMNINRLQVLQRMQQALGPDCIGRREIMSFLFYNAAVQVYRPDEAVKALEEFNDSFVDPIPSPEIANIIKQCARAEYDGQSGFYAMRGSTFLAKLGLSYDDALEYGYRSINTARDRRCSLKRTAERARRDALIIELRETTSMTQAQIAKAVGCSPRTVYSVLSQAHAVKASRTDFAISD